VHFSEIAREQCALYWAQDENPVSQEEGMFQVADFVRRDFRRSIKASMFMEQCGAISPYLWRQALLE
jgi:hypothetical protein